MEELRPLFQGWEEADSIVVNPHKCLFTPIDCSVLYMKDPKKLSPEEQLAEYEESLKNDDWGHQPC